MREFYLKLSAPSRYPPPKIQITRVESKNVRYKKIFNLFFFSLLFFSLSNFIYCLKSKKFLFYIIFFLMFLAVQSYEQKQIVCTFNQFIKKYRHNTTYIGTCTIYSQSLHINNITHFQAMSSKVGENLFFSVHSHKKNTILKQLKVEVVFCWPVNFYTLYHRL